MASRVVAPATADLSAAVPPVGALVMYAGAAAPTGWLLCDGSSYLRSSYAALFSAIGTSYGAADGTHFSVPDLRRRFALGKSAADALGDAAGTFGHTHAMTQPANHAAQAHSGTAVANHAVTQPNPHSNHAVTQANGHTNHAVTQPTVAWPAGVPTQATHTHDAHTSAATGSSGTAKLSGPATHSAIAAVISWPAGVPTAAGAAVDAHSAHAGAAVDAHSAHAGAAVDAHAVTQPNDHALLAHAGVAAATADPPYLVVNYIVRSA